MQNQIETLKSRIIDLTKIMENELADLKNGKVISSEVLEEKIKLTNEIENSSEILKSGISEQERDSFSDAIKSFLDIAAILKFELEKNMIWTNTIISEINNFIEIKLKGVNLYSSDGTNKKNPSHVAPIALFERI